MNWIVNKTAEIIGRKITSTYKTPPLNPSTSNPNSTQVQPNNSARPVAPNTPSFGIPTFSQLKGSGKLGAGKRPEYKIHVISQVRDADNQPIRVSAYLPENISLDFGSTYTTPFNQSVLGDNLFGNVARAFGNSGIVQEMTFKVWESSNGLTFDIPLVFVADDEYNGDSAENSDIMIPILKLSRLCATSKVPGSTFLKPPGANLRFTNNSFSEDFSRQFNEITTNNGIDGETGTINLWDNVSLYAGATKDAFDAAIAGQVAQENVTSVYLGNFLFLDSVQCEAISQNYTMKLGVDGKPMECAVSFRFSTTMIPTIEDLYRYFGKSANNVPVKSVGGS